MLLKFRPRSERELEGRLGKKKFSVSVIRETLEFLKDKRFIDDAAFAKIWVESRIKKPLGLRRLRQELQAKGIDKGIIEGQLSEIKKNYQEEAIVRELIGGKLKKLKGIEPQKAKMRIYGYLLRRGFSPEVIIDLLNQR